MFSRVAVDKAQRGTILDVMSEAMQAAARRIVEHMGGGFQTAFQRLRARLQPLLDRAQAIARQGITADVEEVADTPGRIEITPHAESLAPELHQRLLTAIEDSRPAGVLVALKGAQPPRKVNLELRLTTTSGLLEQDLRAAQRAVREKIGDYFARLPAKEPGSVNRIVGLVLSVSEIQDVRLLSATWTVNGAVQNVLDLTAGQLTAGGFPTVLGELHIADPNLPTRLTAIIAFPQDQPPPDRPAIQSSLTDALTVLNELNANEQVSEADRTLSYGKLLFVIPLPKEGKPTGSLAQAATTPLLPDETSILPYKVQLVFTLESGLTKVLSKSSDKYLLTPFERLSLGGVEVTMETGNA